jgi:hypothetical protein
MMPPLNRPNMNPDHSMDRNDALMKRHENRAEADAPIQNKDSKPSIARVAYDVREGALAKYGMEVPYLGFLIFSVREDPTDPHGKLQVVGLSIVTDQEAMFD